MPRKPSPNGPSWNFYVDKAGRSGLPYVKASINRWDPEKKQARIAKRVHVGRLQEDLSIRPGKAFLEAFPQYAGKELFFFENKLLERDEYLKVNPEAAEQEEQLRQEQLLAEQTPQELLELDRRQMSLEYGRTATAWSHLQSSGILDSLDSAFGKEDGHLLAAISVYLLCEPSGSMQNFATWLGGVYLPNVPPLSGQRISELLRRVNRGKTNAFFRSRYDVLMSKAREARKQLSDKAPSAEFCPLTIAFESTSIPTYSETNELAEYGKARRDGHLPQINLALACDQNTGEVIYAHEYRGLVNDNASLSYLLDCMGENGIEFNEIELVTDRGYKSVFNIQKQIDSGLKIVTGCPITEGALKKLFVKHKAELQSHIHYSTKFDCSAIVVKGELWQQRTESGCVTVKVNTHLYYSDELALNEKRSVLANVEEILEAKIENRKVDPKQWADYGRLICNIGSKDSPNWVKNSEEICRRLEFAGCFAIKTNAYSDPWAALTVYRQRGKIEALYRILKSDLSGERLSVTGKSCAGKTFAFVLAMSLRCLLSRKLRTVCEARKIAVPGNSLDAVLCVIRGMTMHRSASSLRWMPDLTTKKQRDYLALLDVLPLRRRWRAD